MNLLMEYLPFLIPVIVLELALTVAALIHVQRHRSYRFGNRAFWTVMCFVQIIGPIIYLVFGRGEEQ